MKNRLDQFFLKDPKVVEKIILALDLKPKDKILEIGAGEGVLTSALAKNGNQVIAVEIDPQFKEKLQKIPGKVTIVIKNALNVLKSKPSNLCFNKITGSLPSSIIEPLVHLLVKTKFDTAVFLFPLKFAYKLANHPLFPAFFDVEILEKVSRYCFYPVPRTNWALVRLTPKPDPLKTQEKERFLKQYLYFHPKAKPLNALSEGLIIFHHSLGEKLTKKEAKKIIQTQNPLLENKGG